EVDVATFEEANGQPGTPPGEAAAAAWSPPAPALTVPMPVITDVVEVNIFSDVGGPTLAAVIELISPTNKDRPAHRDAFVAQCTTCLQQGLGLRLVDVVTER